ncbi:LysR family transcriptional regulator [Pseudoduganella namucuonensis]|uniref:Transcriptional regulator, LysR family n=1 Tax=Pseudoduganella namucuonensis TaxID=1035707 RepID=A0A1I7M277_9BURK|nr:LysR family transcriptional regulator [Pseudoduganella namucuonensis]SFV16005.1 transcriptional regulator, LysR family [Pseudoduganella namucuonensis]
MEPLNYLASFIQSAETGSFSAAARRLGLTPAAVSKNVARLEASLGLRLFQRSTRSLTLTSGGERFLHQVGGAFSTVQEAIAGVAKDDGQPAGVLKVGMALAFGREHLLPLLDDFLLRYPGVLPDWHFDNHPVDLVGGGFDAAIGGGIVLSPGVIARELLRTDLLVVASPEYMKGRAMPDHPTELARFDGIVRRSASTGRAKVWTLRHDDGDEGQALLRPRVIFDDPEAMAYAAMRGIGVALLPMPHAARWLKSGALLRLLPRWRGEAGTVSIYYPSKKMLPAKTRAFVDHVVEHFRRPEVAAVFDSGRYR